MSSSLMGQVVQIFDVKNNEPLESVMLTNKELTVSVTSSIKGQVDISNFKKSDEIVFQLLGYRTKIVSYTEIVASNYLILLEPLFNELDGIIISATRWNQTSGSIPAKVSRITTKDIKMQNPQTAADLLGSSNEVFIQKSQQGGGSPMIRGFATNRLLYVVDGVRMNSAIFRAGNIQNVISLDPLALSSAEVLFGPGSVMYGSDAIGGVMVFQSMLPQLSLDQNFNFKGNLVSRFSSANNEITNHADIQMAWKNFSSITSFTYSNFGDLKMGLNGRDEYLKTFYVDRVNNMDIVVQNSNSRIQNPSQYAQLNLMQKLRFQPNKNWDLQYGFHYSESSEFARYDRLIETDKDGKPIFAVWNYGPQKWMLNNFSITHLKPAYLYDVFTIRLSHQLFEESRIDRRFNHNRLRTQLENVNAYSGNIDFNKKLGNHQLFYGAEYVLNKVASYGSAIDIRNGSPIDVPDRYPLSDWSSMALYLNHQYTFTDNFYLQTGFRLNKFGIESDFSRHLSFYDFDFTTSSIRNESLNGSIGVVYRPDNKWKISANISNGFRAPNVDDIGKIFDFGPSEVIVPNASLHAENAYNGEISINKTMGNFIQLDATAFYTHLANAMVRRSFTVGGQDSIVFNGVKSKVYALQNAAFATVYGFNIGIKVHLPLGIKVSSRYNYQKGREEMDNEEISSSRHGAPSFGINQITYEKNKFTVQLSHLYNGQVSHNNLNIEERLKPFIYAKDSNGKPFSPAWYTLNLKMMFELSKNITFSGGIENITDQRYRPYSSGLVAPGRNYIASLRLQL
jgi:hemoglobin/transferrin/lactoferrin receptor protein